MSDIKTIVDQALNKEQELLASLSINEQDKKQVGAIITNKLKMAKDLRLHNQPDAEDLKDPFVKLDKKQIYIESVFYNNIKDNDYAKYFGHIQMDNSTLEKAVAGNDKIKEMIKSMEEYENQKTKQIEQLLKERRKTLRKSREPPEIDTLDEKTIDNIKQHQMFGSPALYNDNLLMPDIDLCASYFNNFGRIGDPEFARQDLTWVDDNEFLYTAPIKGTCRR